MSRNCSLMGAMSQHDRTFPATGCSMCILAPYLVTAGRHPNIEMITCAEPKPVSGAPGNFTAVVRKKARSIRIHR